MTHLMNKPQRTLSNAEKNYRAFRAQKRLSAPLRSLRFVCSSLLIVALLAGCTAFSPVEIPPAINAQGEVFRIQAELNIWLGTLIAYERQPPCGGAVVVGCHNPRVAEKATDLATSAYAAISAAQAVVRAGEASDDERLAALALAHSGLAELARYLVSEGIEDE